MYGTNYPRSRVRSDSPPDQEQRETKDQPGNQLEPDEQTPTAMPPSEAPAPQDSSGAADSAKAAEPQSFRYRIKLDLKYHAGKLIRTKWGEYFESAEYGEGDFSASAFTDLLATAMDKEGFQSGVITSIQVAIKSVNPKSRYKRISLDDINHDIWDQKIRPICQTEFTSFSNQGIDITFEVVGRLVEELAVPKRTIINVDSPTSSPSRRRTRTTQLEEAAAERMDRNEEAGILIGKLITRWLCSKEDCVNKGAFCYVDFTGSHYCLNTIQKEHWAGTISRGQDGASVENPPHKMYYHLITQQGSVGKHLKHPLAAERRQEAREDHKANSDRFSSMMEKMERLAEMKLNRAMQTSMLSMVESVDDLNSQKSPYQQGPAQQQYQFPPFPPTHYPQLPVYPSYRPQSPSPQSSRIEKESKSVTAASAATVIDEQPRSSSPVAVPSEEDDAMDSFWDWMIEKTRRPEARRVLEESRDKVLEQMWTLEQLKQLSNTKSEIHGRALGLGMPHGLLTNMRARMTEYKSAWRSQYQLSRQLLALGQTPAR